jgi:DNA-binding transcriptional ArsR family regulator
MPNSRSSNESAERISDISDSDFIVKLREQLVGKTMRVYWYILRSSQPATVRGIQRSLHLSSPSLVLHHLDKLRKLGLIDQDEDGLYRLRREVRVGLLRFFAGYRRFMVPRQVLYASFYAATLVAYLVLFGFSLTPSSILLAAILGLGCATSLYEAFVILRVAMFKL